MTVPIWPESLPRPLRDGFEAQDQEARRPQQTDIGPLGFRGKYSNAACVVRLKVDLSRNEKAIFEQFFVEDTARGKRHFYMPDPTTDCWALLSSTGAPLATDEGRPILLAARWLCLFSEGLPVEQVYGVRFRKSFSVLVLP